MHVLKLAEEHPVGAGLTVFGGGLFLLWILGYFSKAPQPTGDGGMAAAYYAAQQTQTLAGTQLQMAQSNNVAQTAQAQIAADAAVKINSQNTLTATDIAHTQASATTKLGFQQLLSIIVPAEMPYTGGGVAINIPDYLGGDATGTTGTTGSGKAPNTFSIGSGAMFDSPAQLAASGFTPDQIANYVNNLGLGFGH
jgi:hypothetical protein